ncbi:hypothetical protein B0T25DRAFT_618055 [Lasiosphaeria hispida]|uniref:Dehydrogenase FUB6 n=1 Tax=Lasiosphaeria hispida TaxID=260671 RepID=A0AAJ0M7F6_9PEZI|nr:hypothetical protein B0T25DRAFT_618055 [Lasiosphaeria hispida]
MSITNKTLIFKKAPTSGLPIAGEHLIVADLGPFDPSTPPPPGGVTLSILQASLDPFLTDKMRDPSIESYTPAYTLNGPVTNDAVARIIQSSAPGFAPGDLILGNLPFAEYTVLDAASVTSEIRAVLPNPFNWQGHDLGLFLGPLGIAGLTAWSALYEIGKPKAGETIFISSAAGAVGQMVGQIAKREGMRVIGSVGSEEKLKFVVEELGFDGGFNYKEEEAGEALKRLAPEGVDIYFDNVGGAQLDAALWAMNERGRIIACGMITQYNRDPKDWDGVKNLLCLVDKRLVMRGFIVADPDFGAAYLKDHQTKMHQWLADGSIKAKLDVTEGLENATQGLLDLFTGKNFGKAVLKIKDE